MYRLTYFLILPLVLLSSCQTGASKTPTPNLSDKKIVLTSKAFKEGTAIPRQYTCDGADISPPLSWSSLPSGTKSMAIIADDPDAPAGTWVHWVIYNIPRDAKKLDAGLPSRDALPNGIRQGKNDFRKIGYNGPCPPSGTHSYYFKIYALDTKLKLPDGATKAKLLKAIKGHTLAQGQLMGRYTR